MKRTITVFILILLFAAVSGLFAQTTSGKETTIEELYLQNLEVQIISEQASSTDYEMKLLALKSLKGMVDEGRITQDDERVMQILDSLSKEGVGKVVREDGRQINNFPMVRREACAILGQIGGEDAKNSLLNVLLSDNEPMVRAEAVYSLGLIGLNENNEVTKIISWVILQQDLTRPDNNFAFASILALEKIAEKNNGIK